MTEKESSFWLYPDPNRINNNLGGKGITRRNKLIDDLVVGLTTAYVAADRGWNMKEAIKDAIQIADLTIAESNK